MKMKKTRRGLESRNGFSMVELMIVLALIGTTTVVGAVYISSGETELRKFARNVRFDLERAKHEAAARKDTIFVELSYDPPTIDCDEDGSLTDKDHCYVIYEDRNGDGQYNPGTNEGIKAEMASSTMHFINDEGPRGLLFSFAPTGESKYMNVDIKAGVPVKDSCCPNRCMAVSYEVTVSHVGRINVGDKKGACQGQPEESCVDSSYCN
jgi:prepilin-type N-terminal cleavage/methylation domain-containing protein